MEYVDLLGIYSVGSQWRVLKPFTNANKIFKIKLNIWGNFSSYATRLFGSFLSPYQS